MLGMSSGCGCSGMKSLKQKKSPLKVKLSKKRRSKRSKSPKRPKRSMSRMNQKVRRSRTRSKVRIPVRKENFLTRFGYGAYKSESVRHSALTKAVKAYGASSVVKKLNVLVIYNKNNQPQLSKLFAEDRDWVSRNWIH